MITGTFHAECFDKHHQLRWSTTYPNLVTLVGKNTALDIYFSTTSNPISAYLGLISSVSFLAISADDSMNNKYWLEAGATNAPTYTEHRKTANWSAASNATKTLSTPVNFIISTPGTVKGSFLVFGPGASNVIDDTGGTLYSAGLFAGGDKVCFPEDTISVNYVASL